MPLPELARPSPGGVDRLLGIFKGFLLESPGAPWLTGAAWLVLLASDILGPPLVDISLYGGIWPVLFDTRFGIVWCVRVALTFVLGLLLLRQALLSLQLAAAIALAALLALVGHAGATPGAVGDIHLVSDMTHLLAAAAWLGGLPAFALMLWQA